MSMIKFGTLRFETPKFESVSIATAAIASCLFLLLLLVPEVAFLLFSIEDSESAFFICRRAAMLFLGISVFTWCGRRAQHSESRQALCLGLAVSMCALAILGVAEFMRGFAGMGIFLAVVTEAVLAVLYLSVWFDNRHSA